MSNLAWTQLCALLKALAGTVLQQCEGQWKWHKEFLEAIFYWLLAMDMEPCTVSGVGLYLPFLFYSLQLTSSLRALIICLLVVSGEGDFCEG